MTDYELVSLFYQIQSNLTGSTANFMTGAFAMLVAGYLVGHRLDRVATGILLVIFSVFTLGLGNEMRGLASDMALVGREITSRAAADPTSDLMWHPAAGGLDFGFIWPTVVGMTALIYIGAVWFFFRARAANHVGFDRVEPAVNPEG
jgi:hypothetical protein